MLRTAPPPRRTGERARRASHSATRAGRRPADDAARRRPPPHSRKHARKTRYTPPIYKPGGAQMPQLNAHGRHASSMRNHTQYVTYRLARPATTTDSTAVRSASSQHRTRRHRRAAPSPARPLFETTRRTTPQSVRLHRDGRRAIRQSASAILSASSPSIYDCAHHILNPAVRRGMRPHHAPMAGAGASALAECSDPGSWRDDGGGARKSARRGDASAAALAPPPPVPCA